MSLQTSKCRTLIDLAMTGKPKFEILSYLVQRGLSVLDTKDPNLPPKTLQLLMESGLSLGKRDDGELSGHLSHADSTDQSIASIEDAVSTTNPRARIWQHHHLIHTLTIFLSSVLVCYLLRKGHGLCPDTLWSPMLLQWLRGATRGLPHLQGWVLTLAHLPSMINSREALSRHFLHFIWSTASYRKAPVKPLKTQTSWHY